MIGQYKGFIPENVAPKNVNTISIYNSENVKKASMGVPEFMKYPTGTPLYSFGVMADIHIAENTDGNTYAVDDFDYALSYLKTKGAKMACIAGDLTTLGFYDDNGNLYTNQFALYKQIKDKYADSNFKVYAITGNHESYNAHPITDNLDKLEEYTGCPLYYSVMQGDDVFLFAGQPSGTVFLNSEEIQWLQQQLTTYADKRCFLFVHPYITNDSGDTLNTHSLGLGGGGGDIFGYMSQANKTAFLTALRTHGNITVFHGHSHFKFECQNDDKTTNYTNKNGFHSVHVPSTSVPRIITYNGTEPQMTGVYGGAQFYYVEVFSDSIVLNGVDIGLENSSRTPKLIPQGIIKIDT